MGRNNCNLYFPTVSSHCSHPRTMRPNLRRFIHTSSDLIQLSCLINRANMPDKASEEKANLAKKLAEQRAKGLEGIPTTAKVRHTIAFIDHVNKYYNILIITITIIIFFFLFLTS